VTYGFMANDQSLEASSPVRGASYVDKQPPPFGHPLLEYFCFEPGYVNLNTGCSFLLMTRFLEKTD
jgi:hypothetical protein